MKAIEANVKSFGKVHVMPRKVYWIGMPESFRDKNRMDLFQRDIWIIRFTTEKLKMLVNQTDIIIFINLDIVLYSSRGTSVTPEVSAMNKIIKEIAFIKPLHTIVHTTHINTKFQEVFSKASITYIEKNLHDVAAAMATITKSVNYVYEKTNRSARSFLRIEIDESKKLPIKCTLKKDSRIIIIDGYIADLSLNGIHIKFSKDSGNEERIKEFVLKDFIELVFLLGPLPVKIQKALVARIDYAQHSIGVYFEIHNEKMIKRNYADIFTDNIYQFIKEVLKNEDAV